MNLLVIVAVGLGIYAALTVTLLLVQRFILSRLASRAIIESFAAPMHLLAFALAFWLCVRVSTFEANDPQPHAAADGVLFVALLWLALKLFIVGIFEIYFRRVRMRVVPGVLQAVLAGCVYFIAFVIVMHLGFDYDISDLIITSAVVALVLGIAFQSSLAGLFTGLSVILDDSILAGDHIEVGGFKGRIEEKGSRHLRLSTAEGEEVLIPYREVVTLPIVNHGRRLGAVCVTIPVSKDIAPNLAKSRLFEGAHRTIGVAEHPQPTLALQDIGADQYVLAISVVPVANTNTPELEDRLRSMAWYCLRRIDAQEHDTVRDDRVPPSITDALRRVPMFTVLEADEIEAVAGLAHRELFGKGERLFMQGDPGDSLFVVEQGRIEVSMEKTSGIAASATTRLAIVEPGGFLGERALITGEPRFATATLLEDSVLIVIDKSVMREVLLERDAMKARLGELILQQDLDRAVLQHVDATVPPAPRTLGLAIRAVSELFGL